MATKEVQLVTLQPLSGRLRNRAKASLDIAWFEIEHLHKLASLDSINEAHGSPMIDTCLNQGSSLVHDVISRQKQSFGFPSETTHRRYDHGLDGTRWQTKHSYPQRWGFTAYRRRGTYHAHGLLPCLALPCLRLRLRPYQSNPIRDHLPEPGSVGNYQRFPGADR